METTNKNQWDYLFAHRNYIQTLTDELNKVERYTRKNNFRIIGYPEEKDENVKTIVKKILTTKLGIEEVEVERAHRDGKVYKGKGTPRPRHILVKLLRYSDKVKIFKGWRTCLKDESYKVVDDLTKFDYEEKKRWRVEVAELYKKGHKLRFINGLWRDIKGNKAPFYNKDNVGFQLDPEMENATLNFDR